MKKNLSQNEEQIKEQSNTECCSQTDTPLADGRRRSFLKYLALSIPVMSVFRAESAIALTTEETDKSNLPPQVGDRLTTFLKRDQGPSIKASDIEELAKPMLVLPKDPKSGLIRDGSRFNQILLQKLPIESLSVETRAMSADGIVAYTAICTHTGCPVTGWADDDETYMCPCHQSVFSPKESGKVVSGPAPRSLPAIPVSVIDNEIVISGGFNSWVGFGKGRR
jgi:rieske iron-sulfur protein